MPALHEGFDGRRADKVNTKDGFIITKLSEMGITDEQGVDEVNIHVEIPQNSGEKTIIGGNLKPDFQEEKDAVYVVAQGNYLEEEGERLTVTRSYILGPDGRTRVIDKWNKWTESQGSGQNTTFSTQVPNKSIGLEFWEKIQTAVEAERS
ncbi:MAG: hypothetical protein ACOX6V_00935 [Patescibacteria group bacterium]|jgi:hypothetical protein